jgi:hypothetical protein
MLQPEIQASASRPGHGTRDKAKRKESKHENANKSEIGTFIEKGKAEYTSQFTISI